MLLNFNVLIYFYQHFSGFVFTIMDESVHVNNTVTLNLEFPHRLDLNEVHTNISFHITIFSICWNLFTEFEIFVDINFDNYNENGIENEIASLT